jgi:chitinase
MILVCVLGCAGYAISDEEAPVQVQAQEPSPPPFRVIAFYKGPPDDVEKYEVEKLTHIIFSFTHLRDCTMVIENADDEKTLQRLVALKKNHPALKVLISFGGWGGCETCSDVFAVPANRTHFAQSAKALLEKYKADGLDMDWESPVIGGYKEHRHSEDDRANFTALMQELRSTLPREKELCFDANCFDSYLKRSVDWKAVTPLVDWINLMSYTLPANTPGYTGHYAALYSTPQQFESTDRGVRFLDSAGVPPGKIVIGAAFYGIAYEDVEPGNNGLYQPAKKKVFVNYNKLITTYSDSAGYKFHWDTIAQAGYRYNAKAKVFVTYDDPQSVAMKTEYATDRKLGGIMFWRINGDLPREGLLDAIYSEKLRRKTK